MAARQRRLRRRRRSAMVVLVLGVRGACWLWCWMSLMHCCQVGGAREVGVVKMERDRICGGSAFYLFRGLVPLPLPCAKALLHVLLSPFRLALFDFFLALRVALRLLVCDSLGRAFCLFKITPCASACAGSKGEKLMESLFAMAAADGSRLLLLGIANSVDLVQRLMRPGGALHVRAAQGGGMAGLAWLVGWLIGWQSISACLLACLCVCLPVYMC